MDAEPPRDELLPIVDAHHHLWNLERSPQAWLTGALSPIARTFDPDELAPLLDASDVSRTILVQSACTDADTDQLFVHAAEHDWIGAVTAWLPLASPAQTRDASLDELADEPKLRGVRHLIHDEADPHWILRPTCSRASPCSRSADSSSSSPSSSRATSATSPRSRARFPG